MTFSQYKENCEVLLYYLRIQGEDIEGSAKNSIMNILHEIIDLHSRRLIADLPAYGIKWIEKLQ